jgi:hypothetical protein
VHVLDSGLPALMPADDKGAVEIMDENGQPYHSNANRMERGLQRQETNLSPIQKDKPTARGSTSALALQPANSCYRGRESKRSSKGHDIQRPSTFRAMAWCQVGAFGPIC